LAIHNPGSTPQFYVSCAQINVTGGSGTANPTTVSIPGAFKATDPGYTANVSFNPSEMAMAILGDRLEIGADKWQIYNNFNSYTVPGPAPMTC